MPEGSPRSLVLATRNQGKLVEMIDLLAALPWRVEGLPSDAPDYEEKGETFEENARGKALFASQLVELPILADDSGLHIDALGGEPGVRSARYLDPAMSQHDRNRAVLAKLAAVPSERRTARFVCHLVLAHRGRIVHEVTGRCEGRIATHERGSGGFGYDPIFLVPELGRTFAQLSRSEKAARSHRGAAARQIASYLAAWRP